MAHWALISDDLTGALDTALQFRKVGLRTLVSTRTGRWPSDADVVALSTESRHAQSQDACKRVRNAVRELLFDPPNRIYKKTDSLLRGNIGPELEELLEMTGGDALVFAPAFPTGGRTTIDSVHRLWGDPVADAAPGRDPLTPVRESHIPTLIQATSGLRVEDFSLEQVRAEPESLRARFDAARAAGANILLPDVETDDDLASIVAALDGLNLRRICAGSAGLAEFLARRSQVPELSPPASVRARHVAAIVGTPAEHTAKQVAKLEATMRVERIACHAGAVDFGAIFARARQAWTAGRFVLIDAVVPGPTPSAEQTQAQRELVTQLARRLQRDVPDLGLILTGGDTALAAFEGMELDTVELREEIEWGVPSGVTAEGRAHRMPIVTKGGTMGGELALVTAFERIGPRLTPGVRRPAARF